MKSSLQRVGERSKDKERDEKAIESRNALNGYTRSDWLIIALVGLTIVPFVFVVFFGMGNGSPFVVVAILGLAIVAAGFLLSWAVEGLETVMAQSLALALLALIEVAPEYAVEITLAWRQQIELAASSMTGANRLLLGLGWPLILFIAYFSARRRGEKFAEIQLDRRRSADILFLLIASAYSFIIVLKGTLSLFDSAILIFIYGAYIFTQLRRPRLDADEMEEVGVGIGGRTKELRGAAKWITIGGFLAFGAFVLYFGAEPFIESILDLARGLGVSQFFMIQWVAPFLSEFPESLTAFLWAATVIFAAQGLGNLISSKLNQWTLLIAAIPIAYSLSVGKITAVQLTPQSVDELFLTAAQSLFGVALLLSQRFRLRDAVALLILFLIQFVIPVEYIRVILAWLYLALAAVVLIRRRREIGLFRKPHPTRQGG